MASTARISPLCGGKVILMRLGYAVLSLILLFSAVSSSNARSADETGLVWIDATPKQAGIDQVQNPQSCGIGYFAGRRYMQPGSTTSYQIGVVKQDPNGDGYYASSMFFENVKQPELNWTSFSPTEIITFLDLNNTSSSETVWTYVNNNTLGLAFGKNDFNIVHKCETTGNTGLSVAAPADITIYPHFIANFSAHFSQTNRSIVNLTWAPFNATNLTNITIYRTLGGEINITNYQGAEAIAVLDPSATNYVIESSNPCLDYYYAAYGFSDVGLRAISATVPNSDYGQPRPFYLLTPTEDMQLNDESILFSWERSLDPSPLESVNYELHMYSAADPNNPILSQSLTQTSYLLNNSQFGNYTWKVRAYDDCGFETYGSAKRNLALNSNGGAVTIVGGTSPNPGYVNDGKLATSSAISLGFSSLSVEFPSHPEVNRVQLEYTLAQPDSNVPYSHRFEIYNNQAFSSSFRYLRDGSRMIFDGAMPPSNSQNVRLQFSMDAPFASSLSGSLVELKVHGARSAFSVNRRPSAPNSILCNGVECPANPTFNETINLECLGSIDPEGEPLTYSIEAYYNKMLGTEYGNNGWTKKRGITITENSGTQLSDYPILLNIPFSSGMKSDFSDLRFENDANFAHLPYWIENKVDYSYAKVWVKVPSIPAKGSKQITMHYGNPDAYYEGNASSICDGPFGEDIEGNSTCWLYREDFSTDVFQNPLWRRSKPWPDVFVESGALRLPRYMGPNWADYNQSTPIAALTQSKDIALETRTLFDTYGSGNGYKSGSHTINTKIGTITYMQYRDYPGNGWAINNGFTGIMEPNPPTPVYIRARAVFSTEQESLYVNVTDGSGLTFVGSSIRELGDISGYGYSQYWDSNMAIDWIGFRKFIDPAPTYSIGQELPDYGFAWYELGTHPSGGTFDWDISNITRQQNAALRCRAIDATGSNTYTAYFQSNANLSLNYNYEPTAPTALLCNGLPCSANYEFEDPINISCSGSSDLENNAITYMVESFIYPNSTTGMWWNYTWNKRKNLQITEKSGMALFNYTIPINFTYEGGMLLNFSDLRFVAGNKQLDYWIEKKQDGAWAYAWVEIDSIPENGSVIIGMYYGNPKSSSASNETAVFLFIEEFENGEYNASYFTSGSGTISYSNQSNCVVGSCMELYLQGNRWIQTSIPSINATNRHVRWFVNGYNAYRPYSGLSLSPAYSALWTDYNNNDLWESTDGGAYETAPVVDKWQQFDVYATDGKVRISIDGTLVLNYTASGKLNNYAMLIGGYSSASSGIMLIDSWRARTYVSPEPQVSIGSEEDGTIYAWNTIGSHGEGSFMEWNTAAFEANAHSGLRCRAIDLDGSKLYSGYYSPNVNITINKANLPPILNAIGNRTVVENSTLTIQLLATDEDGNPLTYGITGVLPSVYYFNPSSGLFGWTPSFNDAGTYTVEFNVTDGNLSDIESIAITVVNLNQPPMLALIGSRNIFENSSLTVQLNATDPDGNNLTYGIITNIPLGYSFQTQTGLFSWTPSFSQAGGYTATFNVTDGQASDLETITITVNNQNRPPILALVGNKSVMENSTLTIQLGATDADADPLTFAIIGTIPSNYSFNTSSGRFIWTPSQTDAGNYSVKFRVADESSFDEETIIISVLDMNTPPTTPTTLLCNGSPCNGYHIYNGSINLSCSGALDEQGDQVTYFLEARYKSTLEGLTPWPFQPWKNRKDIVMEGTAYSQLSNFALPIMVYYEPEMKPDFSDLRFLDGNGINELKYFIYNKTNSSFANVLLKLPQLNSADDAKIIMYFGNPSAQSKSNLSAVCPQNFGYDVEGNGACWIYREDFNSNVFTQPEWTSYSDGGRISSSVSNGNLIIPTGWWSIHGWALYAPQNPIVNLSSNNNIAIETRTRFDTAGAYNGYKSGAHQLRYGTQSITYGMYRSGDGWQINNNWTGLVNPNPQTPVWVRMRAIYNSSEEALFANVSDGMRLGKIGTGASSINYIGGLRWFQEDWDINMTIDWVGVRQLPPENYFSYPWKTISQLSEGATFNWNTSSEPLQNGVQVRCRAIDLNGSGQYSGYLSPQMNITIWQNSAPNLLPLQNANISENSTITFELSASDADGDSLQFYLESGITSQYSLDHNTGSFSWTPTFDDAGLRTLAFNVTDGKLWDRERANITVINTNRKPDIPSNPYPANNQTNASRYIVLSWNGSDPDSYDANLRYSLFYGEQPDPYLLHYNFTNSTYNLTAAGIIPSYGAIIYWKIATYDSYGNLSIGPIWKFTVRQNGPPQGTISNVTVYEMGTALIEPKMFDDEPINYEINSPKFAWNGRYFSWNPGPSDSGEYDFVITASDGEFAVNKPVHVSVVNKCTSYDKFKMCWIGCTCARAQK